MKLFLIGGFLGSGKTTAITSASKMLMDEGRKVAVITNDQGEQQVDGQSVRNEGITTREVSNGCFCCNYNDLDAHIQALNEEEKPEFIFAESVGSCTDLIATIAKPLTKFRPEIETVISVFADASILLAVLEGKDLYSTEVMYIYRKQLEEADLLIVNKIDLLDDTLIKELRKQLQVIFPDKALLFQNSLDRKQVTAWMDKAMAFKAPFYRHSLDIDYDLYAAGEANLAWFDKSIEIRMPEGKAIGIADKIIHDIHNGIMGEALTIGHLKFYVESEKWKRKISFTIAGRGSLVEWDYHHSETVQMLINARIQTTPEVLERIVESVLTSITNKYACEIRENKWASFKPGYPTPIHRIAE